MKNTHNLRREINQILKRLVTEEISVMITDHNVSQTLNICDHSYIIHEGKVIASGTREDLINNKLVKTRNKIQKTIPGEGYHVWHCEHGALPLGSRIALVMLYLNDVEEGGETEWLYQSRRVKPRTGTMVICPSGFTHTHRGNPPLSGDKYIATGWYQGNIGLTQVQTAGLNDKQYMESMGN